MLPVFSSVWLYAAMVLGLDSDVTFVSPGPSTSILNPVISNAIHPVGSTFTLPGQGPILQKLSPWFYSSSTIWTWYIHLNMSLVSLMFIVALLARLFISLALLDTSYPGCNMLRCFTEALLNESSVDWTVTTERNLSFSNSFIFNLFYDGDLSPASLSETFNITDTSTSSSSTTSFTSSTSSTFVAIHTSSVVYSTNGGMAAGTVSASDETGSVGLATGAKIGIGITIPAVALLGIAAGYFIFRHRAKKQQDVTTSLVPEQVPVDQKPASSIPRPMYELDGSNGSQIFSMAHELDGDSTRH